MLDSVAKAAAESKAKDEEAKRREKAQAEAAAQAAEKAKSEAMKDTHGLLEVAYAGDAAAVQRAISQRANLDCVDDVLRRK